MPRGQNRKTWIRSYRTCLHFRSPGFELGLTILSGTRFCGSPQSIHKRFDNTLKQIPCASLQMTVTTTSAASGAYPLPDIVYISHHKSLGFTKITRKKACNVFGSKGLFLSGFPITISHEDHIPPLRATCPVYLRILT
jgi:hypothetical protein